jgi:hypothetical protein
VSGEADTDRDGLWSAVDDLVDRAPGPSDLRAHGLQLLAGARLRALGRAVPDEIVLEERRAAITALAVPALLHRTRAVYDGRLMIMKGAEVALHYRDPALRPFGDIDLLVDDAEAARRALLAAGFREIGPPYDDGHHHLPPLAWPGLPATVELHRRPHWVDALARPSVREIFEAAEPSGLGVAGVLAPARHHHALLLAGHAWTHEPLRRLLDVIDIAAVTEGTDRARVRAIARRWGCKRLWRTTELAMDAVLYGAPLTVASRTWARHLQGARERTILESRVLRLAGPAWGLRRRHVPTAVLDAIALHLRRHDDEPWRAKLERTRRIARSGARPRSELRQLREARPTAGRAGTSAARRRVPPG